MSEKTEAVSEFAKRRSLTQQRQYLPIFAVRNEVSQGDSDSIKTFIYSKITDCHKHKKNVCLKSFGKVFNN